MVGRKQLYVPMGVLDFLQYALGLDPDVCHLCQLEHFDSCVQCPDRATDSEEDEIRWAKKNEAMDVSDDSILHAIIAVAHLSHESRFCKKVRPSCSELVSCQYGTLEGIQSQDV